MLFFYFSPFAEIKGVEATKEDETNFALW